MPLEEFKEMNPGLRLTSTVVTLPSDKIGKIPLEFVSCVSEVFKLRVQATTDEHCSIRYNYLQEQARKMVMNNSKARLCE